MPSRPRHAGAAALTMVCLLLAACAAPQATATPDATVASGEPTALATPEPSSTLTSIEPTPSAATSASAAPSDPSATVSPEPANDPDDGVATDPSLPEPSAEPGSEVATAPITLTSWGVADSAFEAAAVIDGVVDEGTCTMTLTRRNVTRAVSGPSARSATSSNCAQGLSIPLEDLTSGGWSLAVRFASDSATGVTATQEVRVP